MAGKGWKRAILEYYDIVGENIINRSLDKKKGPRRALKLFSVILV
jgi:hypothetical protein